MGRGFEPQSLMRIGPIPLQLYLIRGDNVAVIGEVDTDVDSALDLDSMSAAPLKHITH